MFVEGATDIFVVNYAKKFHSILIPNIVLWLHYMQGFSDQDRLKIHTIIVVTVAVATKQNLFVTGVIFCHTHHVLPHYPLQRHHTNVRAYQIAGGSTVFPRLVHAKNKENTADPLDRIFTEARYYWIFVRGH